MIPPVMFHAIRAAQTGAPKAARDGGGSGGGGSAGYGARFAILLAVLAVLGAVLAIAWHNPPGRRRPPVTAVELVALEPLVRGALADVGAAPADLQMARSETRFWKRRYEELSAVASTRVAPERVGPFLRALGDSIRSQLVAGNATVRDVTSTQWPDSLRPERPTGPARLSLPYATRRRAGWVMIQALADEDDLTLWLTIHEGPRPSDD